MPKDSKSFRPVILYSCRPYYKKYSCQRFSFLHLSESSCFRLQFSNWLHCNHLITIHFHLSSHWSPTNVSSQPNCFHLSLEPSNNFQLHNINLPSTSKTSSFCREVHWIQTLTGSLMATLCHSSEWILGSRTVLVLNQIRFRGRGDITFQKTHSYVVISLVWSETIGIKPAQKSYFAK